jgi:hypothetical protein
MNRLLKKIFPVFPVTWQEAGQEKMDFKLLRGKSVPIFIVGNRRMNGFFVTRFESRYQHYLKSENS